VPFRTTAPRWLLHTAFPLPPLNRNRVTVRLLVALPCVLVTDTTPFVRWRLLPALPLPDTGDAGLPRFLPGPQARCWRLWTCWTFHIMQFCWLLVGQHTPTTETTGDTVTPNEHPATRALPLYLLHRPFHTTDGTWYRTTTHLPAAGIPTVPLGSPVTLRLPPLPTLHDQVTFNG